MLETVYRCTVTDDKNTVIYLSDPVCLACPTYVAVFQQWYAVQNSLTLGNRPGKIEFQEANGLAAIPTDDNE
jgi:hypothetical protein